MLIGLLPRLWMSADGFHTLRTRLSHWVDDRRGARDPRLRDAALHASASSRTRRGEQVLVNQDLHGDNVLAAQREPWLLIDPKPLANERRVRARTDHPLRTSSAICKRDVLYRLDRLTGDLGLDA